MQKYMDVAVVFNGTFVHFFVIVVQLPARKDQMHVIGGYVDFSSSNTLQISDCAAVVDNHRYLLSRRCVYKYLIVCGARRSDL